LFVIQEDSLRGLSRYEIQYRWRNNRFAAEREIDELRDAVEGSVERLEDTFQQTGDTESKEGLLGNGDA
jgi:hypothetical protein